MSRLRTAAVVLSLLFAATSSFFFTAMLVSAKALAADQPKASTAPKTIPQPTGQKLIALTFDDGPRPYVLYGKGQGDRGLLDLLDKDNVKATFFYMGWRLTPKTWGERHETNIGKTCLDAAADVYKRGHELENHTYSHLDAKHAQKLAAAAAPGSARHFARATRRLGKSPFRPARSQATGVKWRRSRPHSARSVSPSAPMEFPRCDPDHRTKAALKAKLQSPPRCNELRRLTIWQRQRGDRHRAPKVWNHATRGGSSVSTRYPDATRSGRPTIPAALVPGPWPWYRAC